MVKERQCLVVISMFKNGQFGVVNSVFIKGQFLGGY